MERKVFSRKFCKFFKVCIFITIFLKTNNCSIVSRRLHITVIFLVESICARLACDPILHDESQTPLILMTDPAHPPPYLHLVKFVKILNNQFLSTTTSFLPSFLPSLNKGGRGAGGRGIKLEGGLYL